MAKLIIFEEDYFGPDEDTTPIAAIDDSGEFDQLFGMSNTIDQNKLAAKEEVKL